MRADRSKDAIDITSRVLLVDLIRSQKLAAARSSRTIPIIYHVCGCLRFRFPVDFIVGHERREIHVAKQRPETARLKHCRLVILGLPSQVDPAHTPARDLIFRNYLQQYGTIIR
jgi:hypothetical protein